MFEDWLENPKDHLIKIVEMLLSNKVSRSDIAQWASSIYFDDNLSIRDLSIKDGVSYLAVVDARDDAGVFIYGAADFVHWKACLENSTEFNADLN